MGLFEINTFGNIEKYLQLCVIAGVSFFSTLGTVGGTMLATTGLVWLSVATGFFAACVVMAGSVLATARASKLFTKVVDLLPVVPVDPARKPIRTDLDLPGNDRRINAARP